MSEQAETFLNIVANRRSIRAFKPDPVPRAVIEAVMGERSKRRAIVIRSLGSFMWSLVTRWNS